MRTLHIQLVGGFGYGVTVEAGGQRQSAVLKKGGGFFQDFSFDFDDSVQALDVVIQISRPEWAPAPAPGPPLPDETEEIRIPLVADPAFPRGFRAKPGTTPHPRILLQAQLDATSGTPLRIDITFLDVTRFISKAELKALADDTDLHVIPRLPLPLPGSKTGPPRRPRDVDARLFELTVGEHPRLWAVASTRAALEARPFHFVVFLMPKTTEYAHPGAANLTSLRRFLLSPPLDAPFFVKTKMHDVAAWNDRSKFEWVQNPPCGYMEQVLRAQKPVVLVMPVPHGNKNEHRYEALKRDDLDPGPSTATLPPHKKGLRFLLDSLRRALLRSSRRELWPIDKARIAIGGFSEGALDAAKIVLAPNKKTTVEELYLFDPDTFTTSTFEQGMIRWLAKKSCVLRFVGGNQLLPRSDIPQEKRPHLLPALHARLSAIRPGQVSLIPKASIFEEEMYVNAVAAPRHAGQSQPERLSRSTEGAAAQSISAVAGVFLHTDATPSSPLVLEGRQPEVPPVPADKRDLAEVPCSAAEAAAFFRYEYRQLIATNRPLPAMHATTAGPTMRTEGRAYVLRILSDTRHQWAACGGEGDLLRNGGFIGHLHDCISKGTF